MSILIPIQGLNAQSTISTTGSYTANTGTGTVTFNFKNGNTRPVFIKSISSVVNTTNAATFKLWYKTTPINGMPGVIDSTNGWMLVATAPVNSTIGMPTNVIPEPVLTGLNLHIPADTTYGIAVSGYLSSVNTGAQRYNTITAAMPTLFTTNGCTLISGTNVGYAATTEASAAVFTPRGFTGSVTFEMGTLPVVLKAFNATRKNDDAGIEWTTLTEVNIKSFTVQRSTDGILFTSVGEVPAKGSGNSYMLQDKAIDQFATGNLLYYRLLTTDLDGKTELSKVVSVSVNKKSGVILIYPNPFTDKIIIRIQLSADTRFRMILTDSYGKPVKQKEQVLRTGTATVELDNLGSLPHGIYLLQVNNNNTSSSYKLIR